MNKSERAHTIRSTIKQAINIRLGDFNLSAIKKTYECLNKIISSLTINITKMYSNSKFRVQQYDI